MTMCITDLAQMYTLGLRSAMWRAGSYITHERKQPPAKGPPIHDHGRTTHQLKDLPPKGASQTAPKFLQTNSAMVHLRVPPKPKAELDTSNPTTTPRAHHEPKYRQAITKTWVNKGPRQIKDLPKGKPTQAASTMRETTWPITTHKEKTLITGKRVQEAVQQPRANKNPKKSPEQGQGEYNTAKTIQE